jgi:hypothetical protein
VILRGLTSGLPNNVCQPFARGNVVRSMASAYWVSLPDANANREKIGERRMCGTSTTASMTNGLPAIFFASKERVMGTSTTGTVVVWASPGSRPRSVYEFWPTAWENVGTVP